MLLIYFKLNEKDYAIFIWLIGIRVVVKKLNHLYYTAKLNKWKNINMKYNRATREGGW